MVLVQERFSDVGRQVERRCELRGAKESNESRRLKQCSMYMCKVRKVYGDRCNYPVNLSV